MKRTVTKCPRIDDKLADNHRSTLYKRLVGFIDDFFYSLVSQQAIDGGRDEIQKYPEHSQVRFTAVIEQ